MTRYERETMKQLPGELIIRLLGMILLAAVWAALPFVRIGQVIAWARKRQWCCDLAACTVFGLACLFLLWID